MNALRRVLPPVTELNPPGQSNPEALPAAGPVAVAEAALSDAELDRWRAELLDPDSWGEVLGRFGHSMNLAVALTDSNAKLMGPCHNPQPVWHLVRSKVASAPGVCPFCLDPDTPCTAVAEALATKETVFVKDRAGLAHAAIPLLLGSHRLGALIAGQCFSQYPETLSLRRVAKDYEISPQEVWETAIHQVPLSLTTLRTYAELLASLGQAYLRQRYAAVLDRKLDETNHRFRLMLERSKDYALLTVDVNGRVTSWNAGAERLLGYSELEIMGRDYERFFTPEDVQSNYHRHRIRIAGQSGVLEEECWQIRKDGTRFLSETVTARLGQAQATEYGILLHDVTDVRRTAEVVLEAQKLESLGVLAGGIAHDFNNLLTSILGNVSLAMSGLSVEDPTRPLLDAAERSSLKAAALIAQLLAYAGKGAFTVTRFDLSGLVSEIVPLIRTAVPKTVQVELHLPVDLPWINADSSQVQQVIMNLVINGAESFGPEGGALHVSTGAAELEIDQKPRIDAVYLEVRDSGCGMDTVTQSRIFDPFFTTKFAGRGLGLAAVSGIVRKLGGKLDVESFPGEGSTFRVIFPAVPAEVPKLKVLTKEELRGTGLILVVDDDAMVRDLARAVLEQYGYSVLTAENGQEAVNLFRSKADTITAVLLDLTMPVMGGGEAFNLMTGIRPDIPIIISSGYGEDVRAQFTSALAGVIKKPYTVAELRDKLAAVLTLKKNAHTRKTRGASSI